MGKLIDYFDKNPSRFLPNKHQNTEKTELQHKQIVRHFLKYAEGLGIFHTSKINQNILAKYLKQKNWRSAETKEKHKIWLFIMFKKLKKEVKNYVKGL